MLSKVKINPDNIFLSSIILENHPMKYTEPKIRVTYYNLLEKILLANGVVDKSIEYRLKMYKRTFIENLDSQDFKSSISKFTGLFLAIMNFDISFVLLDNYKAKKCLVNFSILDLGDDLLNQTLQNDDFDSLLYFDYRLKKKLPIYGEAMKMKNPICSVFNQYALNKIHFQGDEIRIIVTANMSAGKSTLINALVGKKVARTSQKVCTGNIGYIYRKPFEDNCISMKSASYLNLNADSEELAHYDLNESICIASYFRSLIKTNKRICIIDTPGVNCVTNENHGEMTRYALCNENYDKLLYVFNAGKLGTDDEISHLSWVAENIPSELIIFVVNKLDEYNTYEDNIEENLNSVRSCLEKFGFKNPVICPISAYFGLLIKKKMFDSEMSSEERRDYRYLAEQFEGSEYDLSY